MQRKALQVQVELDIHAVTCPGVFLCPNGKISLQLYMLDSCIQTNFSPPVFPILCHEKFIFYKMFYDAQKLSDLQRLLNKECLYIELIQWQNSEFGNVLATFQTNLSELLYPSTVENTLAGVDIDLLMEPERSFPGVIAPKIEVSTKTIIEDAVLDSMSSSVINPKVIQSKCSKSRGNTVHLKRVCHSTNYHRSRKCIPKVRKQSKPPFIVRKVSEDLLARKPTGLSPIFQEKHCNCYTTKIHSNGQYDHNYNEKLPKIKENTWTKPKTKKKHHFCSNSSHDEFCNVCSKYKFYFEKNSNGQYPNSNRKQCVLVQNDSSRPNENCTCRELTNTKSSKVIRCTSSKEREKYECDCTPKFSTLATKLHKRLNQTLECSDDGGFISASRSPYSPPGSEFSCICPKVCSAKTCKELYDKTKSKFNYERYITPCCM